LRISQIGHAKDYDLPFTLVLPEDVRRADSPRREIPIASGAYLPDYFPVANICPIIFFIDGSAIVSNNSL